MSCLQTHPGLLCDFVSDRNENEIQLFITFDECQLEAAFIIRSSGRITVLHVNLCSYALAHFSAAASVETSQSVCLSRQYMDMMLLSRGGQGCKKYSDPLLKQKY